MQYSDCGFLLISSLRSRNSFQHCCTLVTLLCLSSPSGYSLEPLGSMLLTSSSGKSMLLSRSTEELHAVMLGESIKNCLYCGCLNCWNWTIQGNIVSWERLFGQKQTVTVYKGKCECDYVLYDGYIWPCNFHPYFFVFSLNNNLCVKKTLNNPLWSCSSQDILSPSIQWSMIHLYVIHERVCHW